jgi:hypothetical protein
METHRLLVNPLRAEVALSFYEPPVEDLEVHGWSTEGGEAEIPHPRCYFCEAPC